MTSHRLKVSTLAIMTTLIVAKQLQAGSQSKHDHRDSATGVEQPKQKVIEVSERKEAERHLILFATFVVAVLVMREIVNVYYYFWSAVPMHQHVKAKDLESG